MPRKSLALTLLAAALAAVLLVLSTGLATASVARGTINVTLTDRRADPQGVMRVGDTAVLNGTVTGVPQGSLVVLQVRNRGGAWRRVARTPLQSGGGVHLLWHIGPAARGKIAWRVLIKRAGRVVGSTAPGQLLVGSPFVACRVPSSDINVPAGEGAVVGGVYDWGGGSPGFDHCSTARYSAELLDGNGDTAASQSVAGGHGYALAVKPGSYIVQGAGCTGPQVRVTAGEISHADVYCKVS